MSVASASTLVCPNGGALFTDGQGNTSAACNGTSAPTGGHLMATDRSAPNVATSLTGKLAFTSGDIDSTTTDGWSLGANSGVAVSNAGLYLVTYEVELVTSNASYGNGVTFSLKVNGTDYAASEVIFFDANAANGTYSSMVHRTVLMSLSANDEITLATNSTSANPPQAKMYGITAIRLQ